MGRQSDAASDRMAASVACLAKQNGLACIDDVVLSQATAGKGAGETVFVVQGTLDDPAHLRAHMPTQAAVTAPAETSLQELARLEVVSQQASIREQAESVAREQAAPARTIG